MNGVTLEMVGDSLVAIISDTGLFIVPTEVNSLKYNEEFYPVDEEAREAYGINFDGKLIDMLIR